MVNINVVFDDSYDDVDIISIPNSISVRLEDVVKEFMDWLKNAPEDDTDYWCEVAGQKWTSLETRGFIKWLNNYCCQEERCIIVKQHTNYCPEYGRVDF